VFVGGERVGNVAEHPAFRQAARSIANLYDIAAAPESRERMTFASPKTGEPVLRAYQIPKTHADLRARRLFSEKWAEATFGLMGRTPDHVAGFFCGYAATPRVFAAGGQRFADNLVAFYEHMRDHHLYVSYAIVPPQIDRSKPAHKQSDPTLYAGVVKERDDGIVIAGAQQLATGGAISDYIHLSCIHPLQPGDENYANCVAVPVNAPGVKLYPRRPFALNATNAFDYPLSSRFDESDSTVVFDHVFVPWECVFIYRNIEISRDQWWKTPSHLYGNHQAQVRYVTKLRFMIGIAKRMNEMTGNEANPAVQILMGELAALVSIYESMLLAHETVATIDDTGVLWPSRTTLYSAMALQSELNGRMLEIIRELAGSAMITLPSGAEDFDNPETAHDIERYMGSGTADARSRIALMRLAWDFIGSEFGSRHQQYEKFYGGASFLVKQNVYRNFDFKRAIALVDAALNLPPLEE
jgi:4-hydroxyphenylacetate 3-monooxygenase